MTAPDTTGYRRTTLDVLAACQRLDGRGSAISNTSVVDEAGLSSSSVAHHHLSKLRQDGWLKTVRDARGKIKIVGVACTAEDVTFNQAALALAERIASLSLMDRSQVEDVLGVDAVLDFMAAYPPRSTRDTDGSGISNRASILAHATVVYRRRHHAAKHHDPES